jgi:hypothetical protein
MVDEHVQDLNLACWKEDGKLICTNLKNDLFLKLILPGAQYVGERWSSGSYEEFACMYEEIYRMLSSTSPAWRQCKSHDDNVDFKLCFKTLASAWARHVWTCEKDEHMLPKNEIKLMLEQQLSPPLQLEPAIVLAKEDLDAQEQPNLSVEQEERRRTPTPPPPPAASPQPCSSSQADENDRIFASLADTPRRRFPPKERLKRNLHLHHQDSIELLIKTDHSSSSSTSFAVESEVVHQPASPEKRPMLRRQQAICADHSYSSAGRSRTRLQVKREMEQETAVTRGGLEVQYVDLTKEEEDEDKEKELTSRSSCTTQTQFRRAAARWRLKSPTETQESSERKLKQTRTTSTIKSIILLHLASFLQAASLPPSAAAADRTPFGRRGATTEAKGGSDESSGGERRRPKGAATEANLARVVPLFSPRRTRI